MMFRFLWLLREEPFVAEQAIGPDLPAGTYTRHTVIPAPGFVIPPAIFSLSSLWYAAWLALITWGAGGIAPWPYLAAGAAVFALNATIRGGMKVRERMASLAEWPTPVARERAAIRVTAGIVGLLFGIAGAAIVVAGVPGLFPPEGIPFAIGGAGIWEAVQNMIRIRGRFGPSELDLKEYQRWYRDAGSTPSE